MFCTKQFFAILPLKTILLQYWALLLFFPLSAVGQVYVPLISTQDSSDTWKDVHSCSDFDCFTSETKRFTIDGDTIIGALQYAKLQVFEEYEEGTAQSQSCPVGIYYSSYYHGAIRESGKQVFVKPAAFPEYLAYDFNLTVGDTTPFPNNSTGYEADRVINSIDSVLVNGTYRKRYVLASGYEIIEGIGSSSGLFNTTVDFFNCATQMLCYKENGNAHYFTSNCNPILSLNDEFQSVSEGKLLKIVDGLGREIDDAPNTLMIYIYSDGSSKKVFRAE